MSTLISFGVVLVSASGAPPSTPGLRAVAVIVLHVGTLILASLSSCSQHPAVQEKSFAHEAFLRHPGIYDRWTPKHIMRQDASIKELAS